MVHLIVAITGAHRAPDLPLAAAVALWPSSGCRSRSRSWMCQCHRSRRKSWRSLLVRSSATLVQASGDSTGGRAHIEKIVDVPVPRIWEQSVEVIKVIPEEWMSKRIVQQIVDVPVPQIPKQIVEVVLVILQEQCQRMRFFSFDSVWEGGCGRHVPHVLPHSPPPHARVDSECKRWNLEHVVLDLFSHFTLGKVQVRWLCVSCRGSRSSNSHHPSRTPCHGLKKLQFPFLPELRGRGAPMAPVPLKRKRDTSNEPKTDPMKRAYMLVPDEAKLWFVEFHAMDTRFACNIRRAKDLVPELFGSRTSLMPSQPCFVSASPLGSTSTAVCCASSASNSSPADIGHRLSMKRRPIECALMDQSFRASTTQDAFLDMIDAIDADMNARPGDAEQRNCTAYTQPLDQAYMRAFKNSIRSEVAKHFAEFFLEAESNFERVNLDSTNSLLRECRQPATSNRWLALHRLEGGGAA